MRFDVTHWLTRLTEEQYRAGALSAAERKMTSSALAKLKRISDVGDWFLGTVGHDVFVDVGVAYGLPYTRSLAGERAVAIEPCVRPAFRRRIAEDNALERLTKDGQTVR